MFGKIAADVLGISDVGAVIRPENYDKVDADDYVLHEDQEKIFFLIKSKSDEYCFTNQALIHLDGNSAMSKKRVLRRYPYGTYKVTNVSLETAGTVDLDVEIKFSLGSETFTIDVHKKHIEELKDLYKALIKIAEITHENDIALDYAHRSLEVATTAVSNVHKTEADLAVQFGAINKSAFEWLTASRKQFKVRDFGAIFERYINQ
ncbi:PH domain-containing protein [Paenibacillus sp. GCM10023252]|uniref:PH domain-containing protein n=1 Tax=Paenibacillus sp. GCM10023252 TaxID=3252649 RepID=UPI003615B0E8